MTISIPRSAASSISFTICALVLVISPMGAQAQKKQAAVKPRSVEQLTTAEIQAINDCDTLAGSPEDPDGVAAGVPDDDLNGPDIIDVCQAAVSADGGTPRLKFQLARGLLKMDRDEEALEQLVPAAEAGHGGALALLGDIYLSGAAGVEADPAAAKVLYQKAVAAKYLPARKALAKFQDQTKALAQADAEERRLPKTPARPAAATPRVAAVAPVAARSSGSLNTQGYEKPDLMNAIYKGDYVNTGLNRRFTQVYLINMAEPMRQVCRGTFTITEVQGWSRKLLSEVDVSPQAGFDRLRDFGETMRNIIQNPNGMAEVMANQQAVESLPQMAQEDAYTFMERNPCGSAAYNKFVGNMREYFK